MRLSALHPARRAKPAAMRVLPSIQGFRALPAPRPAVPRLSRLSAACCPRCCSRRVSQGIHPSLATCCRRTVQQTNFLLASAGVIPLLALALLLELRMYDAPKRPPTLSMLNYGLLRATLFGGFLWVAGISCYGEWVCLRWWRDSGRLDGNRRPRGFGPLGSRLASTYGASRLTQPRPRPRSSTSTFLQRARSVPKWASKTLGRCTSAERP